MLEAVSALGARGGGVVLGQPCLGEACFPSWKRLEPPWRFSKPSQATGREGGILPVSFGLSVLPARGHCACIGSTTIFFQAAFPWSRRCDKLPLGPLAPQ